MKFHSKAALTLSLLLVFVLAGVSQFAAAQEDVSHVVHGLVKHVDHGAKTMVVKTADGTERTIKWTGKTSWEGSKDAGKGVKDGSEVTVKYTEKGGEKTADAVTTGAKDVGKGVGDAVK